MATMRIIVLLVISLFFTYCSNPSSKSAEPSDGTDPLVQTKDEDYMKGIAEWQQEMDASYANPEESPLMEEDLKKFKGLDFFPADKKFRIEADFERTEKADTIEFTTTTERKPKYYNYGVASFAFNNKEYKLSVYRSLSLMKKEEFKDYLFLPFTDASNGNGSYGGGRYMDLKIQEGNKLVLDFNKCYNPYCLYNKKYSCPVPPVENDLDFEVKAGVMDFVKGE